MRKIIGLCLSLLLISSPVWASSFSSAPPVGIGKIVKGCCDESECAFTAPGVSMGGISFIASPKNVSDVMDWFDDTLTDQVEDMGESYTEGLEKVTASINKSFEIQNANFRQIMIGFAQAGQEAKNIRQFGPNSKVFSNRARKNWQIGARAKKKFEDKIKKHLKSYAEKFESKKKLANRLEQVKKTQIDPHAFFPVNATLKDQRLLTSLDLLADAFPSVKVQKSKSYSDIYHSMLKLKKQRKDAGIAVMADVMAGYAPTVPAGSWMQEQKADQPQKIYNNRMSQVGYLGYLIFSRFANPQYRTGKQGIHAMTRTGVLREIADVQAVSLMIKKRQMKRAQQMAFLMAMKASDKMIPQSLKMKTQLQSVLER